MGWGGAGLGAKEQGIEQPISGGEVSIVGCLVCVTIHYSKAMIQHISNICLDLVICKFFYLDANVNPVPGLSRHVDVGCIAIWGSLMPPSSE
jgi:hypothetical protein